MNSHNIYYVKYNKKPRILSTVLILSLVLVLPILTLACEHQASVVPPVQASAVWSRAMPPSAPTGAVYLVLRNNTASGDIRLVAASTPLADKVELHTHRHVNGLMHMEQIESVVIPAGQSILFKPGGLHLMMFDLHQPLVAGSQFPLQLKFDDGTQLQVSVDILESNPTTEHQHHHSTQP